MKVPLTRLAPLLGGVLLAAAMLGAPPALAQKNEPVGVVTQRPEAAQPAEAPPGATEPAAAEPAAPAAQAPVVADVETLEELVAKIEDEKRREELLGDLKALIALQQAQQAEAAEDGAGTRILTFLSERAQRASANLAKAGVALVAVPGQVAAYVRGGIDDPEIRARRVKAIVTILVTIIAGWLASAITRHLLRRPVELLEAGTAEGWFARLSRLLVRLVLELLPLAVFAFAANLVLPLTKPNLIGRLAALTLVNAFVIGRLPLIVGRMVLTPRLVQLRLFEMSDVNANYAYVWLRRFVLVGVPWYFLVEAMAVLGLPSSAREVLLKVLGLVLAGMAIVLVRQNRAAIAQAIRGTRPGDGEEADDAGAWRERLADTWHGLAITLILLLLVLWLLETEGGFAFLASATALSIGIVLVATMVSLGLERGLQRMFRLDEATRARFPYLQARANLYLPGLQTALRVLVWLVAVVALLQAWQLDVLALLATPEGAAIVRGAVSIALIVAIALVVLEAVNAWVERYLSRTDRTGKLIERSGRIRTLLPLIRNVVRVVLVVIVVLVALDKLGLNIAPLLAGAGVVGLAIGFGAQTLVKDIITGLFILVEDSVSVGDVARVGGHIGGVEGTTIRTITLRDLHGVVHTVPWSEVTTVENLTKDFSFAVLDVGVAYRENTDEVVEVLNEVAEDLRQDPEFSWKILEPLEIIGVDAFADSAVVVRVRFKTRPVQQWSVKREFNRRMKHAFDAHGIEIPFPHTTLYFGEDKTGKAPPAHFLVDQAAAASPTGDPLEKAQPKRDAPQPGTSTSGGAADDVT